MKVITGTYKGCKLSCISGYDVTRPTSSFVKESIFNFLQFEIYDKNVLDLFSGSGQLGIEALSRGAKHCVFVDNYALNIKVINSNLNACKITDNFKVVKTDFLTFLKNCKFSFDIVFLDPPYDKNYYNVCLEELKNLLNSYSFVVCESNKNEKILFDETYYNIYKEKVYSNTKITILNKVN